MFKRFICCALICALLAAAVPTIAFAGASGDALKRLREMRYIDKLCAVNANAPDWHEGMTLAHANSQQMETALRSMLENWILPTLKYLEESVVAQVRTNAEGELCGELRQARDECRAIRDEVQAELDIIEYERQTLPVSADSVFDGTYQTVNQAEAAARRVLLGVERLEDSMSVVSGSYSDWESKLENLDKLVCPDDRRTPATIRILTPIQTHIVDMRAKYMDSLMDEAKRVAAQEQGFVSGAYNKSADVEIYAVPRNKILFDVRNENNEPISKALFKIFCKYDFRDNIRDFKIQEPEAEAPVHSIIKRRSPRRLRRLGLDGLSVKMLN